MQNDPLRIDSHKLEFHPHRVAAWLDGKDDWELAKKIYPLYVEVSPCGACNHRCTFCGIDYIGYEPIQLEANLLNERLWEMGSLGVKSVMFAGEGEPLLHKKINKMVLGAKEAKIDVAFTTNGVLLDKLHELDKCSWVKISLNAGTKETYAKVHRTKESDWDEVWANIREAVKRKGGCEIGVQMVLLPENQSEVETLKKRCKDFGVDYVVIKPYSQHKKSITTQYKGFKPVIPISDERTVVRTNAFRTEEPNYHKCNATPFFWAYIMSTGAVYSCSAYLLDERFKLGNINTESFRDIWEGERRKQNWELVTKELDISECRVNCRMDKANSYLADFDRVHNINFV